MMLDRRAIKKIEETIVVSDEPSYVGVDALLSVLQYHGTDNTLEHLRILSGTNESGSTLFGLQRAAIQCGYQCKGYKLDTEALKECKHPVILSMTAQQSDFFVFYGILDVNNQPKYVVRDSKKGLEYLEQRQLTKLWASNFCLIIEPPTDNHLQTTVIEKLSIVDSMKEQKTLLYGIVSLALLSACLLVLPSSYFVTKFIDEWVGSKSNMLAIAGTMVIVGGSLALLLEVYRKKISMLLLIPFSKSISERFFRAFCHLPKPFFDSYRSESHTKYIGYFQAMESALVQVLKRSVLSIAIVIVALATLAFFSIITFLMLLPLMFIYCWWVLRSKTTKELANNVLRKQLLANKANMLMVEACEIHKLAYENTKETRFYNRVKQAHSFGLFSSFTQEGSLLNERSKAAFFCIGILIAATLINGYLFFTNQLSAGLFAVGVGLCMLIAYNLLAIYEMRYHGHVAKFVLQHVAQFEFTAKQQQVGKLTIPTIESIEISELGFSAIGFNRSILKGANFTAEKGSVTGVIGANGSGKTKLAEILMKQYEYSAGQVSVNKTHSLQHIDIKCWNDLVAIVPQKPVIFPGRLLENITMADAGHNINDVIVFLREFKLDFFFQQFPKGELTSIGTANVTLSPSQEQIICIARALYCKPQLLILDDFAQNLDAQMLEFAFFIIQKIKANTCVVFLTSNAELADKYCDKKFYL